ncbi:MAG: C25 family cysteine peptidase [Thermoplasmatota archaeon]
MKKLVPLIIGILVLSGLGAAVAQENTQTFVLSDSIHFSEPAIIQNRHTVEINLEEANSVLMGEDSYDLPIISKVYTFPLGTSIDEVTVSFSDPYLYTLTSDLNPAPIAQYISTQYQSEKISYETENIDMYPQYQYTYNTGAGRFKGDHVIILSVQLSPMLYFPNENILSISEEASIEVTYTLPKTPIITGDAYDMLILAPDHFSAELQPLIDYKNSRGIDTVLVTLSQIPTQGSDVQEQIKYFIKNAYEDWGFTYVLLVGSGVEGQEVFPVRHVWIPSGSYEAYFPSDLYYADFYRSDMSFASWDHNNNGKYGEIPQDIPAMNIYPDVYLGRLACSDEFEVRSTVNKIINYMKHNQVMEKIVQIAGDTFPGDPQNINEGEYSNIAVMNQLPGYTTERLWASTNTLTKVNIINAINKGVDFVDFSGHGSYMSWATHPPNDPSRWLPDDGKYSGFLNINVPFLFNNKKLPVVFLFACSCHKFSSSENSLGWAFVENSYGGAIASYGASGIAYGMLGTAINDRVFGWMQLNTFKGLYNDKVLGDVWGDCIVGYYNAFNFDIQESDYKTLLQYNLFGDPSLAIETGPDPKSADGYQFPLLTLIHQIIQRTLMRFPFLDRLFTPAILSRLLTQ